MNTAELLSAVASHPVLKRYLGGVVASDQLPEGNKVRNKYYIVNLDASHQPGSHWVVCFKRDEGNLYFDSYGFPPLIARIRQFMGSSFAYNEKILQCPKSTACGQWCLFFVCWVLLGRSMDELSKRFASQDLIKNDHEINHWLKLALNVEENVLDQSFLLKQIARSREVNSSMRYYRKKLL